MSSSAALDIALAYDAAWNARDVDGALSHLADDVVCEAPAGTISGRDAYREFLEGFNQVFTGADVLDALGDESTAIIVQATHTRILDSATSVTRFKVRDGKIVHVLIVFDRLAYEQAQQDAGAA